MSLTLPLAVRLSTAKSDVHVTKDLHDLQFRSTAPGGFATATLTLSRPLAAQPDEIAEFGEVFVYDRRDGSVVWEGRLEDSGRSAGGNGEVWQVAATGPAAHAQDRTIPLVYIDRQFDWWRIGASSASVNVQIGADDGILMSVASGVTMQTNAYGLAGYEGLINSGQALGRASMHWECGTTSGNLEFRLGTAIGSALTVAVDADAANTAGGAITGSRGGTNPIGADHDSVRIRFIRLVSNLLANNDTIWGKFPDPRIRGQLMDSSGTLIVTGYDTDDVLASEVVNDLLGRLLPRYDGPNASVTTTSFLIEQMAYPDGVSAQKVLEDLMTLEPAYYWAAWETTATGKHRFEWRTWPTTIRYEASAADGFDSPSSAGELYNAVSVRWRNPAGVPRVTRRTSTVGILTAAGLTREAFIDLADELGTQANATKAGDEFLLEHGVPVNQGTLTISRPILDMDKGRQVWPWEIRPGHLIRVRDVLPRIDSLNATARDGITVFRIAAVDFDAGTGTATLELDSYPRTVARAIADLAKRRITRRR